MTCTQNTCTRVLARRVRTLRLVPHALEMGMLHANGSHPCKASPVHGSVAGTLVDIEEECELRFHAISAWSQILLALRERCVCLRLCSSAVQKAKPGRRVTFALQNKANELGVSGLECWTRLVLVYRDWCRTLRLRSVFAWRETMRLTVLQRMATRLQHVHRLA